MSKDEEIAFWRRRFWIMAAMFAILLCLPGCLSNGIPLAATCRLYEYIKASAHDTPNTLRQIKKNNRTFRKACVS